MSVSLVSTAVLLPQVGTFAPTCPAFIAEQQIRMAAIELAEVSRSWRHVGITDILWSPGTNITVGNLPSAPPAGRLITHKRIYRSVTSTSGATELFFVAQIPATDVTYSQYTWITTNKLTYTVNAGTHTFRHDYASNLADIQRLYV